MITAAEHNLTLSAGENVTLPEVHVSPARRAYVSADGDGCSLSVQIYRGGWFQFIKAPAAGMKACIPEDQVRLCLVVSSETGGTAHVIVEY